MKKQILSALLFFSLVFGVHATNWTDNILYYSNPTNKATLRIQDTNWQSIVYWFTNEYQTIQGITPTDTNNWNTAYGWGDHSTPIETPDLTGNTYTISTNQYTVLIDDDDAQVTTNIVVTLPAVAVSDEHIFNIKKIGSSFSVVVDGNGAETIDGETNQTIRVQYNSMQIQCDGVSWWIL